MDGLLASLKQRPRAPLAAAGRRRPGPAGGGGAGAGCPRCAALARGPERLRLLLAGLPDPRLPPAAVRRSLPAAGGDLPPAVRPRGRLAADWVDAQLRRLERTEGDLETLLDRMSAVRTWTYVTAKREWVDEAAGLADAHPRPGGSAERRPSPAAGAAVRGCARATAAGARRPASTGARPRRAALAGGRAGRQGRRARLPAEAPASPDGRRLGRAADRRPPRGFARRRRGAPLGGRPGAGAAGARQRSPAPRGQPHADAGRRAPGCGWAGACWPSPAIWWPSCWRRCSCPTAERAGSGGPRAAVPAAAVAGQRGRRRRSATSWRRSSRRNGAGCGTPGWCWDRWRCTTRRC